MLYEVKLKYKNEEEKDVKEHYVLEAESYGDAEKIAYELHPDANIDLTSVFRSGIKEIVNQKEDNKPYFLATVVDPYIDDNGNEKEMKYQMLVCESDVISATEYITEYLKQGYGAIRLDAIRKTRITDYKE